MTAQRTQAAVDTIEISQLQHAYADVVNRRAWPELAELFLPDTRVVLNLRNAAAIELVGPERVGSFIGESIAAMELFEFVILSARIMVSTPSSADGGAARARMYMCEVRQAAGHHTLAYGLYEDDYRYTADGWRIAARNYSSLARSQAPFDVFGMPTLR